MSRWIRFIAGSPQPEPKKRHRDEPLSLLGGKVKERTVDGGTGTGENAAGILSCQLLKGLIEHHRGIADHASYFRA